MKKKFFDRLLVALVLGLLMIITGCPQATSGDDKPIPDNPNVPVTKSLIVAVNVVSDNGYRSVLCDDVQINLKGQARMQVVLKEGIDIDSVKLDAKLANEKIAFKPFQEGWDGISSVCDNVTGVTAEAKEMVITVTSGNIVDSRKFMLKLFDESTLQEIELQSFNIGKTDVKDSLMSGNPSWRVYDPDSNKIKFVATLDKNIEKAVMVVNGSSTVLYPTEADKKVVEAELEFEKNSTKFISFVFQAEGCRDLSVNQFSLTFTNTINIAVSVDSNGVGGGKLLTDAQLMSGGVEFNKCMITEPTIEVKALKIRDAKLTKVSVDGVDITINTENPGDEEEYIARYTLNPPMEKAGDKRTVRVHVEGTNADGSVIKEAIDFDVTFVLVQFIEAKIQIEADGKSFQELQDAHRVYAPTIKVKVISAHDDLKDVVVKDYKDADGNTPEFEINGKEATASLKLQDTGMEPTTFKIIISAEEKTHTPMTLSIRYTAQDDPLQVFFKSFAQGDVEPRLDGEGAHVMTKDEATLYLLLNRNLKELTSMKVNGVEVMGKVQEDPDKICMEAKFTSEQGPGGKSNNAVFVFGGDKMAINRVYTLNISLAGKTEDGHNLAEVTLPPLKIRQPDFGKDNTDWRGPYSNNPELMELTVISKTSHKDDKSGGVLPYNYYGTQSINFAVFTKNPRAKVKGIWYRGDTAHSEFVNIIKDTQEENSPKYGKNFLKFNEGYTPFGKSKWCTTLNLEDDDKKGFGINIYLWVVSEDGTKTTKGKPWGNPKTVDKPILVEFRRVSVSCSETKIDKSVGWKDGWDKAIQVIDKAEIDIDKVTDGKVYCRATTLGYVDGRAELRLFNNAPQSPIADLLLIDDQWKYDNRFTVDVSSIKNGTKDEIEVEIPVFIDYMIPGEEFTANVFTRKFKIVKKS